MGDTNPTSSAFDFIFVREFHVAGQNNFSFDYFSGPTPIIINVCLSIYSIAFRKIDIRNLGAGKRIRYFLRKRKDLSLRTCSTNDYAFGDVSPGNTSHRKATFAVLSDSFFYLFCVFLRLPIRLLIL